jgi:hypothetical protein
MCQARPLNRNGSLRIRFKKNLPGTPRFFILVSLKVESEGFELVICSNMKHNG